tara:strand:+ start:8055 stop:8246 length:192 start_codon:yes stop_codon:yes gene_type:complete
MPDFQSGDEVSITSTRSNELKVSKYAITLGNVKLHHKRDIGGVKSLAFSPFASITQLARVPHL